MTLCEYLQDLFLFVAPLYVIYLLLIWKSVDFYTYHQVDYYKFRKQKWWESGSRYDRFVQEEVRKISGHICKLGEQ